MRSLTLCCCVAVLAGCAKPEQQAVKDTTAALGAGASTAAYASVAGKWAMKTMALGSDSVLVSYELVAGTDPKGWSLQFPNREPIPVRVLSVTADSIITQAGPYQSVLRAGVDVSTYSVFHLQDGKLVGTTVAHYSTAGADSLIDLRTEGTRAP